MSSRSFARAAVALTLPVLLAAGAPAQAAWGLPGVPSGAEGSAAAPAAPAAIAGPPPAPTLVAETPPAEVAPPGAGQPLPDGSPLVDPPAPAVVAAPRKVPDLPPRRLRPRFLVAVSMGTSIDSSWSASMKTFKSPAFAATVGFGDGPVGFGLRLLSSQASGRGADAGPDRLALDVMVAVRPWASRRTVEGLPWGWRVLRTATLDAGLAAERIAAGAASDLRGGPVFGGHVDLPLTPPAGDGELRLRLAVRRMLAGTRTLGNGRVGDSAELLGGLVVAF